MDSNVSKGTFLHKFFKLPFIKEKTSLSIGELLEQMLLSTLHLSQQKSYFALTPKFIADSLRRKMVVLQPFIEPIYSSSQKHQVLLISQSTPIVYSSPIALVLASFTKNNPQTIAKYLVDLLVFQQDCIDSQLYLNSTIEVANSGFINFYLDARSIAIWLERSFALIEAKNSSSHHSLPTPPLDNSYPNLFPAQYVHSRCCSLLNLGVREKLVTLEDNNQPIPWLDEQNNLRLDETIELNLLHQLFLVTDSFAQESVDWHKVALNLSEIVLIFIAQCSFLGEVRQKTPQKAIARLRLIALTQYWLQRILIEKSKVAAPRNL